MLQKIRKAGLIWPTVWAVAGVAALVALGTWQLQRKHWKDGLIAKIAARVDAPPLPLARAEELQASGGDVEYLHVFARGRLLNDKERYLYAPAQAGLGWHVYTPLELAPAPARIVWVNRGFVPDERKLPAARAEGLPPGEIEVRGLVRTLPHPGAFTPNNDVAHNLWYWPDLPAMSTSAFAGGAVQSLPFAIELDAKPEPLGGLPRGGVTRIELPNRHLEYAVTWYGLALTLIGVYFAFAASRLRVHRDAA